MWLEIRIRKVMFSGTRHTKSHQRHKFDVVKKSNNIVIRQKTIIPNIAEVWQQKKLENTWFSRDRDEKFRCIAAVH